MGGNGSPGRAPELWSLADSMVLYVHRHRMVSGTGEVWARVGGGGNGSPGPPLSLFTQLWTLGFRRFHDALRMDLIIYKVFGFTSTETVWFIGDRGGWVAVGALVHLSVHTTHELWSPADSMMFYVHRHRMVGDWGRGGEGGDEGGGNGSPGPPQPLFTQLLALGPHRFHDAFRPQKPYGLLGTGERGEGVAMGAQSNSVHVRTALSSEAPPIPSWFTSTERPYGGRGKGVGGSSRSPGPPQSLLTKLPSSDYLDGWSVA